MDTHRTPMIRRPGVTASDGDLAAAIRAEGYDTADVRRLSDDVRAYCRRRGDAAPDALRAAAGWLVDLARQRDELVATMELHAEQAWQIAMERDSMRRVVEAAEHWRDAPGAVTPGTWYASRSEKLGRAVDAYRTAQDAPPAPAAAQDGMRPATWAEAKAVAVDALLAQEAKRDALAAREAAPAAPQATETATDGDGEAPEAQEALERAAKVVRFSRAQVDEAVAAIDRMTKEAVDLLTERDALRNRHQALRAEVGRITFDLAAEVLDLESRIVSGDYDTSKAHAEGDRETLAHYHDRLSAALAGHGDPDSQGGA